MLRASSARSARTLTRSLRAIRRPDAARKARLRLDSLETREQPGSVLSGTVAGQMIDPLAAMTLAVGEEALLTPLRESTAATTGPTPAPAASIAEPAESSALAGAAEVRESASGLDTTATVGTAPAPLDVSDLSINDPTQFALTPVPPASTGSADGTGGHPSGLPSSSLAGESAAAAPAAFAGTDSANDGTAGSSDGQPADAPPSAPAPAQTGAHRGVIRSATGNGTIRLDAHGLSLDHVRGLKSPGRPADGARLPYGLLGFNVSGVTPGEIAVVDLTLPNAAKPNGYYKLDPGTGDLARFDFDGYTGAVVRGNNVTLVPFPKMLAA